MSSRITPLTWRRRSLGGGKGLLLAALLACAFARQAGAQTGTASGTTPPGAAPGAPAGSYDLSEFDSVNLYSGNLNFTLPLLKVGGRGGAATSINLTINSIKWRIEREAHAIQPLSDAPKLRPGGGVGGRGDTDFDPSDLTPRIAFVAASDDCWLQPNVYCLGAEPTRPTFADPPPLYNEPVLDMGGAGTYYMSYPTPEWWGDLRVGYGPGVMMGRWQGTSGMKTVGSNKTLTRLTFIAGDGTEYELRDALTDGKPAVHSSSVPFTRGKVFVSADGSAMTFISDAEIVERAVVDVGYRLHPSGYLFMPDGSCYRVESGLVRWIRDRNGNVVKFFYGEDPGNVYSFNRVVKVIDALGREVNISYADLSTVFYDSISYAGFNGAPRTIKIWRGPLHDSLRAGFSARTLGQLFPGSSGEELTDPYDPAGVVTAVELPDHRSYQFRYNPYGELARVELPTGGAVEYDYTPWSGVYDRATIHREVIERRVFESSAPGAAPLSKQVYQRSSSGDGTAEHPYFTDVVVGEYDLTLPTAALVSAVKHSFHGDPVAGSAPRVGMKKHLFYPDWHEGREYQVETYDPNGSTDLNNLTPMKLLRRVEQRWEPRAYSNWTDEVQAQGGLDVRLVETVTRLADASPNLMGREAYAYDRYNNRTDLWEYDYQAEGEPWRLLRHTGTKYLTLNPVNGADYACDPAAACGGSPAPDSVVHVRRLPEETWVNEEAGDGNKRSLTRFEYDNYAADAGHRHEPLLPRADISGLCLTPGAGGDCARPSDAGYQTRGNLTGTTSYLLSQSGAELGSITANSQYDVAGNVVRAVDARGYATEFSFEDNFGTPNASARDHAAPAGLQGQKGYAFVTQVTSAVGHAVRNQYDYQTAAVVNFEDANGTVMSLNYGQGDPLDRLTRVVRAANYPDDPALCNQTTYAYDDANRKVTTTGDVRRCGDNLLKREGFYDGLGRATEVRRYEDATHYVATLTKYDALGRAATVSNPYRPLAQPAESLAWTTTEYDVLGRVWRVTTPDGAKVITHFDGLRTLVTDQDGKQRLSVSDALGRTAAIWEVRTADAATGTEALTFPHQADVPDVSFGYKTAYTFDVLGNLRRVEQGAQRRYFAYDSMRRLLRAKNPEQDSRAALALPAGLVSPLSDDNNSWSLEYEYDEGGNLKKRVDARGVETTYAYDPLNRLTVKAYTDVTLPQGGALHTPPVKYYYDDQALPDGAPTFTRGNSLGRLVAVTYGDGSANGSYTGEYDAQGRARYSAQVTTSSDVFGQPGAQTYVFGYEYNSDGSLKSETYPSRRVVESQYDAAGQLAGVKKQGGDYYAGGDPDVANNPNVIGYTPAGSIASLRFGNDLWEHTGYNNRLQPERIRLGTAAVPNSVLQLDYGYGGERNNGNLMSQTTSVPATEGRPGLSTTQVYSYDALNRLESAREVVGPSETWRQSYAYDRYGNRTLDVPQTTLPKLTAPGETERLEVASPSVQPATNRIRGDQDGDGVKEYAYDEAGNVTCEARFCGPTTASPYYGYDAENRIIKAGDGLASGGSSYDYDGEGRRVKKLTGAVVVVFVYDAPGRLIAEYGNAQAQGDGTRYVTQDHLGNVRAVTGQQGEVKARYDYQPFGGELTVGRAGAQGYGAAGAARQKFGGKENDAETGLYFFGARYYSLSAGRFTSCDPASFEKGHLVNPQRWNLYVYVINSPLSLRDPDGRQDEGISGSKVIDVFIPDPNLVDVQKVKTAAEGIRRKTFVQINIIAGDEVGVEGVYNSLQRAGGTTILATHSWAGPKYRGHGTRFLGDAIWLRDGFMGRKGLASTAGENIHPGFGIKVENLIVISCNLTDDVAVTIANRLTTRAGNFVYSTGGYDGECSGSAETDMTIAAMEALAEQKAVSPLVTRIDAVIKAMEGAIFSNTPPPEEQDRLKVLHGPPTRSSHP